MNELITIKQLPIIEERLQVVSEEIDKKVEEALNLAVTEETVKAVKEVRATLNKESKEYEEQRKKVKNQIMKPYEEFETIYKKYIIDKYKKADKDLKEKIDNIENKLKEQKKDEIEAYFNEYLQSKNIDFIEYENANINVTLTASIKSLKEQAKTFIDKIVSDLNLIDTQDHKEEILVEYKQSLNVSQSIMNVTNRIKAIEEEKAKIEAKKEQEEIHVPTIEEVEQVQIKAPTPVEDTEIYTLNFTVKATKTKLKELKEFLENGGYIYE